MMKVIGSWGLVLFAVATLFGFGWALVGTGQFVGAQWLFFIGNLIFFVRLATAFSPIENHRAPWITMILIGMSAVFFVEWQWVEGQKPPVEYFSSVATISSGATESIVAPRITLPIKTTPPTEQQPAHQNVNVSAVGKSRGRTKLAVPSPPQDVSVRVQ